jgi:hypothetical protein
MKGENSPAWYDALQALRVLRECHGRDTLIALLQQELAYELTAQKISEQRCVELNLIGAASRIGHIGEREGKA